MPTWKRILTVDDLGSGGSIDGTGSSGKVALWQDSDTLTFDTGITYNGSSNAVTLGNLTAVSGGGGSGIVTGVTGSFGRLMLSSVDAQASVGQYGAGSRLINKLVPNTAGVSAGRVYYYASTGWTLADKDDGGSINMLAVVTNLANTSSEMLIEGAVKLASNQGFSTAGKGAPLYIGDSGNLVDTAPSGTGDIVRVVGHVLDAANSFVYFRPDNTWIKIA